VLIILLALVWSGDVFEGAIRAVIKEIRFRRNLKEEEREIQTKRHHCEKGFELSTPGPQARG
jgi:hypothetical protein